MGDWHGYGFNNPSNLSLTGGFRGPAFAGERSLKLQWLSDCFEKLTVVEKVGQDMKKIPFTGKATHEYLPGRLCQQLQAGDILIQLKEIAVSDRSTMIEYTLINQGTEEKTIGALLSGKATYKDAQCKALSKNSLGIGVADNKHHFVVSFPENSVLTMKAKNTYETTMESKTVAPGKVVCLLYFYYLLSGSLSRGSDLCSPDIGGKESQEVSKRKSKTLGRLYQQYFGTSDSLSAKVTVTGNGL